MKHKVRNVIETLRRLPAPEYRGQVCRAPVLESVFDWDLSTTPPDVVDKPCYELTVTAELYRRGESSWLEWEIDI